MDSSRPSTYALKTLADLQHLLLGFDAAMLVTREADGGMHARPMALQDPSEMPGCDLWFVSTATTPKVREIERQEQVAVCCFRSGDPAYVSGDPGYLAITALARVEHDPEELRRVYKPEWRMWMPGGPEDPGSVIIKLMVLRAEAWSSEGEHQVFYPERSHPAETQMGV